ncbi:high osmolarity signaling protein Sho1p [Monosporozyma unispora]|nr:Transmembrane osmosensor [Kazachstania unispora]
MNLPKRSVRPRSKFQHSFEMKNLLGDPFALSTISIAFISWIIAIGGSAAAASDNETFPRFTWWGIAFQFVVIVALILFYTFDLVDYYRTFLIGAISICFVYNTNSATNLVYSVGSRKAAASAGVILLSIVNFIWLFYYGGDNASPVNRWIDGFSLKGIKPSPLEHSKLRARRRSSRMATNNLNNGMMGNNNINNTRFASTTSYQNNPNANSNEYVPQHNYMSSNALSGFENTEPRYTPNMEYRDHDNSDNLDTTNNNNANGNNRESAMDDTFMSGTNMDTMMTDTMGLYSELGEEDNFPYSAKALYSYEADANDQYEISFDQGEILRVTDIEGRWWKARRANGDTGIIPSNYVELINTSNKNGNNDVVNNN